MATHGGASNKREALLRAVLLELRTVVDGDAWTVTKRLPAVVQASQLSVYGLLVLKGMSAADADVFPHREKLYVLLDRVLQKSKSVWAVGLTKTAKARQRYLNDVKPIRPATRAAVKYAERAFGLHGERLGGLGVYDLQDTLARFVGRISEAAEAKLAPGEAGMGTGVVPGAVQAAMGLGVMVGGVAGRREMTAKEASAARLLSRLGAKKDEADHPEPKPLKKLRKTLQELAAHLPEQRR